MKKRIVSLIALVFVILSVSALYSCSAKGTPEEGTVTRMTVDINPSIEFMVDDQNKVVSVTALNDDGSILIAGEVLIGKTPEEAAEAVIEIAAETGYLVGGNAEADENTVKISVSGDSKYAEDLLAKVESGVGEKLTELDISGKIEKVAALNTEALKALALETSLYTEEELAEMDDSELYRVIAAGRIETAELLTAEMREAYYTAKEYKISFVEREETAKIIEEMGGIYSLITAGYRTALTAYSEAITALDNFRYETLVSPESSYQKSLEELRQAKSDFLIEKNYVATLDVNGETYASATVSLQLTEENYEKALAAYEAMGESANAALEQLIATLRQCEAALISIEESFSPDITAELTAKATEMESTLNASKDAFFAEFETAHKDDIASLEATLVARKQALIDGVNADAE